MFRIISFYFPVLLLGATDKTKEGLRAFFPHSPSNYKHIQLITHKSHFHRCARSERTRWEWEAVGQEQWHTLIHKEKIIISHSLAYVCACTSEPESVCFWQTSWPFVIRLMIWALTESCVGICSCMSCCARPSVHSLEERWMFIWFWVCVERPIACVLFVGGLMHTCCFEIKQLGGSIFQADLLTLYFTLPFYLVLFLL